MAGRSSTGAVERATRAELRRRAVSVQSDGMAALAVAMAKRIDAEQDAKAAAALSRELRAAMVALARAHPAAPVERDDVDELRTRRQARRHA